MKKIIAFFGILIAPLCGTAGVVSADEEVVEPKLEMELVFICAEGNEYHLIYNGTPSGVPEEGSASAGLLMIGTEPENSAVSNNPAVVSGNTAFSFIQAVPGTATYAGATVTLGYEWGNLETAIGTELPGNCQAPDPYQESVEEPVEQTATAKVVADCEGMLTSGLVKFHPLLVTDTLLSVRLGNGSKGGQVLGDILVQAGTGEFGFSYEQLQTIGAAMTENPQSLQLSLVLTTEKGGGNTVFPISLVDPDECVAVEEPPVPTTTVPEVEVGEPPVPPILAMETKAECQSFMVTNTGNVASVSEWNDFGYTFEGDSQPPYLLKLAPGESLVVDLEVGQTIILNDDAYDITGPTKYTAVSCESEELPADSTPTMGTLPATGSFSNATMTLFAVLAISLGSGLVLVSRRK